LLHLVSLGNRTMRILTSIRHPLFSPMRISNPLLWKLPTPYALSVQAIAAPALTIEEIALLLSVGASVVLDVVNNITLYVGTHNSAIAVCKGLILVLVVGSFRTSYSYLITTCLCSVFLLREMQVVGEVDSSLTDDAIFFLRIMFFVTWLLLFYEKRDRRTFLRCVLWIFVGTVALSVVCQLAGLAFRIDFFKAYADQRGGYKGLFFAENDTAVFYLIAWVYSMFLWKSGKRLFTTLNLAGLLVLAAGSKTALLGSLTVPVVYFYFSHNFRGPFNFRKLTIRPRSAIQWASGSAAIGVTSYLAVRYISEVLSGINYEQLLRVYQESGLLSSVLSYRDVKVLAYFHSIRSIPDVLFGLQAHTGFQDFALDAPGAFMYEIDLFDYLARVGLIGSIVTLALIGKAATLRHWRSCTPELKTMVVIVFLLGFTVGHTLISSMNGIWIAFWLVTYGNVSCLQQVRRVPLNHGQASR
jgi:hypothetical protein